MAIQVLYQAPELMLSGNPIAFQLQSEAEKISCSLYLEQDLGSGDYLLIHTEIRPVDSAGKVLFDFAAVIHAELQLEAYDFAATNIQEARKVCRRYFVAMQEGIVDQVSAEIADWLSAPKYALKAAQHFMHFDQNSLPFNGNKLLSLKPASRSFMPGQNDWIWLLPQQSGQPIALNYTVSLGDGSFKDGSFNFGTTEKFLPVGIPLHSVFELEYSLDPNLKAIRIQLLDQELELLPDFQDLPYTREFYFSNPLGGFDSLLSYGKAQQTESFSAQMARNYTGFNAIQGQLSRHNVEAKKSVRLNVGYRSLQDREAAKALLYAQLAFEKVNGQFWPIISTSSRIQDEKDGDFRYTLQFDYDYAFNHSPLWL